MEARDTTLSTKANFGCIPFDLFALEKWDYDQPPEGDRRQWESLSKKYLSLTPKQREPYHAIAQELQENDYQSTHPFLTPNNITRVLKPHQTVQERNISQFVDAPTCCAPVWVRACYDPALDYEYNEFLGDCLSKGEIVSEDDMILDDASLYNLGPDHGKAATLNLVLSRMPSICDIVRWRYEELLPEIDDDGSCEAIELASSKVVTYLYLVDKEAIEEKMVKLLWLDSHGNCVWNSKIEPGQLSGMMGMFQGGFSLDEAVEGYCTYGSSGLDEP